MNRLTYFAAGCLALSLAACPPPLTPAGQQVRLRTTRPFGCTELGTLRGPGDSIDHSASEDATSSSHSDLRNDAAEMGANYVSLEGPDVLGASVVAHAFRCEAPPTEAPNLNAAPAPASPRAPDLEERLKKLQDLFDKGLITREEYDQRRAVILQSL
jgi:Domain of unknown function (DUF4156)/Short C-terminal domain